MGVAGSALIGRNEELARLEAFVEGTADGPPRLLLEGEAGIGKTTLWRAGVERAHELGFRVLESRPAAPERELSFAALGDLLSGTHDEIGDLPAPQRRALRVALLLEEAEGEPTDQRAVAAALLGLLRRLTADEPLVIALDDIQWLDSPSSGALQFAFRRLDNEPVRVLATSRLRAEATTMSFDDAERMEVGGLPLKALGQLVRRDSGRVSSDRRCFSSRRRQAGIRSMRSKSPRACCDRACASNRENRCRYRRSSVRSCVIGSPGSRQALARLR